MQTKLDIAILTAGRVDLFAKCVEAIKSQMKPEYKIHVCNNGFPSPEYEAIYKALPEGSIIRRSNVNMGYGGGANSAMKSGNAPLVLLITDDVFLHDGAIDSLLETMKDQTIAQCGLKLLFPEDSVDTNRPAGKVQHVGLAANIRGEVVHPLIGWSANNPKCCISKEVMSVTGAAFMVRRSYLQKAGYFNPAYGRGYYEDADLSFTIRSLGGRIYIDTGAIATHGVGQTFKALSNEPPPPVQQNQLIFRSRWLSHMAWSDWETW